MVLVGWLCGGGGLLRLILSSWNRISTLITGGGGEVAGVRGVEARGGSHKFPKCGPYCVPRLPVTQNVRSVIKDPRKRFNGLPQYFEHPVVLILLSDEKEDGLSCRADGVQHQCAVAAHRL